MNRAQAWDHYFATGDREPIVKAYWKSIEYIAWSRYRNQKEDMFQWGMIGLLKAIRTVDVTKVKSLDAWVWLNVRGMMNNYFRPQPMHSSLDEQVTETLTLSEVLGQDENFVLQIDVRDALKRAKDVNDARKILTDGGYTPSVRKSEAHKESQIARFRAGLISLRGLARELGISKRQAYKLTGGLPATW
jgi:RNA polymerase sigma factor (sigma-70 family)